MRSKERKRKRRRKIDFSCLLLLLLLLLYYYVFSFYCVCVCVCVYTSFAFLVDFHRRGMMIHQLMREFVFHCPTQCVYDGVSCAKMSSFSLFLYMRQAGRGGSRIDFLSVCTCMYIPLVYSSLRSLLNCMAFMKEQFFFLFFLFLISATL